MRLNKPTAAKPPPAAAPAPNAPRAPGRKWPKRVAAGALVLALAALAAWFAFRTDPVSEARAALDRRDFATANELLAARLADRPGDEAAHLLAIRAARRSGDFERAAKHLAEFSKRHPTGAAHRHEVALQFAHQGHRGEADKLFAEYADRPDDPEMPFVMEAYIEGTLRALAPVPGMRFDPATGERAAVDRLRRAVDLWCAARSGTEDRAQGLAWRGRVLFYANDHAGAVAALRAALELDPDHHDAGFALALARSEEAPREAAEQLERLHSAWPNDGIVTFYLAVTRRTLGRATDARSLFEPLAAGSGALSIAALVELGQLELDEGRPAVAEPLLRRALERQPDRPEVLAALARCMHLAGKPDEAARFRQKFDQVEAAHRAPAP